MRLSASHRHSVAHTGPGAASGGPGLAVVGGSGGGGSSKGLLSLGFTYRS